MPPRDENNNVDRVLTYVYTGDGQLYSVHDSKTGFLYRYTYDSIGRLIGSSVKNADDEVLMSTRQEYNANNELVGQHWTVGTTTYSETYTYSTVDGALTSYNNALGQTINLQYDSLRRISKMDTTTMDRFYEYADGKEANQTTGLVSRYWYHTASYDDAYFKYSYAYDALGNITSYSQHGTTYTYNYDDQNQLISQSGGGKTYTYTYDNAGNIKTASNGTTTNSYTYGNALWKDQLTAFNGQTITYDGSGNPLSYYNGKRYTFTWEEGRNLVSAAEGTNTYTYAYDSSGLRISKTVNGVKHEYLYASGKLLRETVSENGVVTVILDFVYDHSGHPFALNYTIDGTSTRYYYITNLQGDVLAMITGQGVVVASYSYDPYGKVISATKEMAEINPLRYRGYYYDTETGFYYLQSRYYDPTICRFINADSYASTGQGILGNNTFIYCLNNPCILVDNFGLFASNCCYVSQSVYVNSPIMDRYMEIIEEFEKAGITLYYSKEGALDAWIDIYLPLSQEYEYVTFLYGVHTPLGTRYYTSVTIKGEKDGLIFNANVIGGTVMLAWQDSVTTSTLLGHVHTHPEPQEGYHNDFPSTGGLAGGDELAFHLFNFPEMYIIPYKRCSSTPEIILYTDESTWCQHMSN